MPNELDNYKEPELGDSQLQAAAKIGKMLGELQSSTIRETLDKDHYLRTGFKLKSGYYARQQTQEKKGLIRTKRFIREAEVEGGTNLDNEYLVHAGLTEEQVADNPMYIRLLNTGDGNVKVIHVGSAGQLTVRQTGGRNVKDEDPKKESIVWYPGELNNGDLEFLRRFYFGSALAQIIAQEFHSWEEFVRALAKATGDTSNADNFVSPPGTEEIGSRFKEAIERYKESPYKKSMDENLVKMFRAFGNGSLFSLPQPSKGVANKELK